MKPSASILIRLKNTGKLLSVAVLTAALSACFSTPKPDPEPEDTRSAEQILAQKRQQVAFGQVLYSYFQDVPDQTLLQEALTRLNEQIAQTPYETDNNDRLELMKGAVSLQLGMTQQAEIIFNRLLSDSTDDYIRANTWFWLAKSGFAQKRDRISQRAYAAIMDNDLDDELSEEHFEELLYQVSHEKMEAGEDWLTIANELPSDSIYQTYLLANQAVISHSQADYETANNYFIAAKQQLDNTPIENAVQDPADNNSWWSWFDWFGNGLSATQEEQANKERNALFDRLNYGLGISLLDNKDYTNALIALQQIGRESLEAEQSLLTYGWTLAQENRWPLAMAAWQYLRDNSQGIYALQASHGLAFGYEQQGALAEAFQSLRDSSRQLDIAMSTLETFDLAVQEEDFFDTVTDGNWPVEHRDLQILLLSGDGEIDSAYLLDVRRQAKQLLNTLDGNLRQIDSMYRLLDEREQAFIERSENLSLTTAQLTLDEALTRIETYEEALNAANVPMTLFANEEQLSAIARLEKSEQRIERINNERERKLSKKYAQRVARLKGFLAWQLSEAYPESRWQHQKQLNHLKGAYQQADKQYQQLSSLQNNTAIIDEQRSRVDAMAVSANADYVKTKALVDSITARLTQFLRANMAMRMQELADQQVATRLAIIRLQDLAQPERGR
ncbi:MULTISPECIES: hypothetical protein [Alteromonadaceae]|uniref:Uncharacterized protein n=1 Tax=Brumicola blandensis TaxID=3075611 RepID=A0AAW8R4I6_9ALTE|nr:MULTISPECIES: hypothetical protein [unclassified Alteromonas]MDT0583835.1 hypothetical protein [Alteromonas sp. W409]MDT0629924.1 hypothetical protein [Alteromonas sp. W364]